MYKKLLIHRLGGPPSPTGEGFLACSFYSTPTFDIESKKVLVRDGKEFFNILLTKARFCDTLLRGAKKSTMLYKRRLLWKKKKTILD